MPDSTPDDLAADLRAAFSSAGRLLQHAGARLDAMSLDLARDIGAVVRDAQALAADAAAAATAAADQATSFYRATPRAARLAQEGAALLARHRWLRLRAAARGDVGLRDEDHRDLARRATAAAARLRGGVAKLGQLASCRPDLIGAIWASELAALQDEVPPVDVTLIRARIAAELGRPVTDDRSLAAAPEPGEEGAAPAPSTAIFATFDDVPIAAASLAQVHGATLPDGRRVAVKVQVPGIEDVIAADIAALRAITSAIGELPGVDLATLTDELARALLGELDYVAEAAALRVFAGGGVRVPEPIAEASSRRVLTMSRLDGERLIPVLEAAEPAVRARLLAALVGEVAAQVLARGHVHADPHPGNFLVVDGELAMLDFGCTLTLSASERGAYARLVLAIAGGDPKAAGRELAALGFRADDPDLLVELTGSLIAAMRPGASVATVDWQAAVADQLAYARRLGGLVIPRSFVLLGRVLATVAGLLARFRPEIELHALLGPHLAAALSATPA